MPRIGRGGGEPQVPLFSLWKHLPPPSSLSHNTNGNLPRRDPIKGEERKEIVYICRHPERRGMKRTHSFSSLRVYKYCIR